MDINNSIHTSIHNLLDSMPIDNNLDFLKNIQLTKHSRKRQDNLNKASKKCRDKKRRLFILMQNHIEKLHNTLINNKKDKNVLVMIRTFNEEVEKIKNNIILNQ